MSPIGFFAGVWKRAIKWLSSVSRSPYPSMARHMGGAGAMLFAVVVLFSLAELLGWLRDLPDALDAVLIAAFITAATGAVLLANTRTLDETGTREVLAVELDQISKRCTWPSALTPVNTEVADSVRAELFKFWQSPLSLDGLESARPKLFLLPRDLIAQVLELYRALEEHHKPQRETKNLSTWLYSMDAVGGSTTANGWSLDLLARRRAQLFYYSAKLAQTLSPTKERKKRVVQLHDDLKANMPEALDPL